LSVFIDLMGLKLEKGAVTQHVGHCAEQRLLFGLVFKGDEQQFIVAVGIGKFYSRPWRISAVPCGFGHRA
jgi:hypothetical protein